MKAFTDISQSKKLSEFLPLESADMYYPWYIEEDGDTIESGHRISIPSVGNLATYKINKRILSCWSLAALLNYLREIDFFPNIEADEHSVTMSINYYDEEEARLLAPVHNIKAKAESFIDACYELILKCYEQKIL